MGPGIAFRPGGFGPAVPIGPTASMMPSPTSDKPAVAAGGGVTPPTQFMPSAAPGPAMRPPMAPPSMGTGAGPAMRPAAIAAPVSGGPGPAMRPMMGGSYGGGPGPAIRPMNPVPSVGGSGIATGGTGIGPQLSLASVLRARQGY